MQPLVVKPALDSPGSASTWAWYGLTQALQMLGVSYREAPEAATTDTLVLDPARGQIGLRCPPSDGLDEIPAADLLRVTHAAVFFAGGAMQTDLPLFGPVVAAPARAAVPTIVETPGDRPVGPLFTGEPSAGGWRLQFHARLFETLGLYLSRFSWPGNSSFRSFVREVDDLWDRDLRPRWERRAVVNEYLQVLAGILCHCYAELRMPLATAWPHPCRGGTVMQHGLIVSHDVDQLFPEPAWRSRLDQTGNPRFCLPQWRQLEEQLGLRSAYYFYTPRPGDRYWFEPHYSPTDPAVAAGIRELLAGGWEVSLHQMSHDDREALLGENSFFLEAVGRPTTGTRSHYLKHTFATLSYKAQAGLRYDSTWYTEQTNSGFLCGCALPYRPLDCATLAPVGLWEFPFVIEDGIVFGCYGEGTSRDVAGAVADGALALDQVLAHDGFACLNWHNYTFSGMSGPGRPADSWPPGQTGLVEYLRRHSPTLWTPLPIELADWCTRREAVRVEANEGQIVVTNEGPADCPDFVLCLQHPVGTEANLPPGAQALGRRGSRLLHALPLSLRAGERLEVALDRAE